MILCNNGDNYIADSTITNTGENINFPNSNLYNDTIKEPTLFDDEIIFDLGSALQVTAIAIVNPSQTLTIEANTIDSWGSPAYSYTFTPADTPYSQVAVDVKVIDETYRYWRVSGTGTVSVGHLFIGAVTYFDFADIGEYPEQENTDVKSISQGGQLYYTEGLPLRSAEFEFDSQDRNLFLQKYDDFLNKRTRPGVFAQFEDSLDISQPFFAYVDGFENDGWNQSINYSWTVTFREVR
jgi:hypothetical protein